jgi:uncharacterized protein
MITRSRHSARIPMSSWVTGYTSTRATAATPSPSSNGVCAPRPASSASACRARASTFPADDPSYAPLYRLCADARAPVLIMVGTTGLGAGQPGGGGVRLDASHPRHLDEVAARHPELILVASRPAWPWQTEMIAILLHKSSVWYELHGWSPRYFAPDLKLEIGRRLQDRVMFGADYPLLGYERLLADWKSEGYAEDVLERVLRSNAEAFLATLRR